MARNCPLYLCKVVNWKGRIDWASEAQLCKRIRQTTCVLQIRMGNQDSIDSLGHPGQREKMKKKEAQMEKGRINEVRSWKELLRNKNRMTDLFRREKEEKERKEKIDR